jgi:hypothetical protein
MRRDRTDAAARTLVRLAIDSLSEDAKSRLRFLGDPETRELARNCAGRVRVRLARMKRRTKCRPPEKSARA